MSLISYKFNTSADADNPNSFTEEHRKAMEGLISLEAYPEKYDNTRFKTVEFVGFRVIPATKIRMDTVQPSGTSVTWQKARKGGSITDKETKDLDNSLKTKSGNWWSPSSIDVVLKNRTYTGIYQRSGVIITQNHPNIINEKLIYVV